MKIRTALAVAALCLASAGAHADEFRCGKTFITFHSLHGLYGGERLVKGVVTVPKVDVLRVFTVEGQAHSPTLAVLKPAAAKGALRVRAISPHTRQRIIECID